MHQNHNTATNVELQLCGKTSFSTPLSTPELPQTADILVHAEKSNSIAVGDISEKQKQKESNASQILCKANVINMSVYTLQTTLTSICCSVDRADTHLRSFDTPHQQHGSTALHQDSVVE